MEEQDQSNVTSENANVIAAKSQVLPVERDDESSATVTEKRKYLDNKTCTKKAKLFRIERKQKKLLAQGKSQTEIEDMMAVNKGKQVEPKSLDEFFNDLDNRKSKLEVKTKSKEGKGILIDYKFLFQFERVASSEILKNKSLLQEIFSVYKKYQTVIHKDPPDEVNESSFVNFLVKSPITVSGAIFIYYYTLQSDNNNNCRFIFSQTRVMVPFTSSTESMASWLPQVW